MFRLQTSGDICPNPGPATATALKCPVCARTIARNHRALNCESCQLKYHIKCGKVSPREYTALQTSNPLNWKCLSCILVTASKNYDQQEGPDLDITNNHSQLEDIYGKVSSQLSRFPKDIRVAHLNVCSIRNKIDELRCLQLSCRFEVLAITETHLDKSIPSTSLKIDGMKMLRFDRLDRKGGGCVLYFAEYLNAMHRRDLSIEGLQAIWLQVKFPQTTVLFPVIYRPPDAKNFFDLISIPLEKAWLKSSSIFLLGDFNCDLSPFNILQNGIADSSTMAPTINSSKLISTFDNFNMQNVINEPARVTPTTSSLIDLIVTTRKDLVTSLAAVPLGLSDHSLIYATLRLKNKRHQNKGLQKARRDGFP